MYHFGVGCPRNKTKKISVRTETNQNKICFCCVSVCFMKPKISDCFGLFWCLNLYRNNQCKQNCFETNRKKPKQPYIFWKIPKYFLYQTVSVGLLFVSIQMKHRNLFRYRSETTKTNYFKTNQNKPKQTGKTLNFLKKISKYAPVKLFRLVFCLFRFNRNMETLCFGVEAKPFETNVLFLIVPKLVSVSVLVFSNRN